MLVMDKTAGEIIQELRKQHNETQESLAEGQAALSLGVRHEK